MNTKTKKFELSANAAKKIYNNSEKMLDSIAVADIILEKLYARIEAAAKEGKCETYITFGYEHLDDLFFNPASSSIHKNADANLVQSNVISKLKSLGYEIGYEKGINDQQGIVLIDWK